MTGILASRTVFVSSAGSAARRRGAVKAVVAPAKAKVVSNERLSIAIIASPARPGSRLQLAFQLIEEAPVGAVGEDLFRTGFDQTGLVQSQRVEAQRVLGIVI